MSSDEIIVLAVSILFAVAGFFLIRMTSKGSRHDRDNKDSKKK